MVDLNAIPSQCLGLSARGRTGNVACTSPCPRRRTPPACWRIRVVRFQITCATPPGSPAHGQTVEPKRHRCLRNAFGHRTAHPPACQQFPEVFPVHPRKYHAQTLAGTRPCLESIQVAQERAAGLECRAPDSRSIAPTGDGMEATKTNAESGASIAVCQGALADSEQQLDSRLGGASGDVETPFEVFGQIHCGYDLLQHLWCLVFRSDGSRATAGKGSVDVDTTQRQVDR